MVVRVEYDPSTGYAYERQVIGLSMQPPEGDFSVGRPSSPGPPLALAVTRCRPLIYNLLEYCKLNLSLR